MARKLPCYYINQGRVLKILTVCVAKPPPFYYTTVKICSKIMDVIDQVFFFLKSEVLTYNMNGF